MQRQSLGWVLLATALLAGCGSFGNLENIGKLEPAPRALDVGMAPHTQTRLPARVAVAIPPVVAAPLLAGTGVLWREAGDQLPQRYASYRWAAEPAALVGQRLQERLAVEGPIVDDNVTGTLPELRVSLERFEQVFSSAQASEGHMSLRVVLMENGAVADQLRLTYALPAATQDAPGGAQALRTALDTAADAVAAWLAARPSLQARPVAPAPAQAEVAPR